MNSNELKGDLILTKPSAGELIRLERKKMKLSISELSDKTGVSQPYISQLENDKRKPSFEIIHKINSVLKIDNYLLAWAAGLYSDVEYKQILDFKKTEENMTDDERIKYEKAEIETTKKILNLLKYEKTYHVNIEDVMQNNNRHLYINGYELDDELLQALKIILNNKKGLKKYPSPIEIEKEYDEIMSKRVENTERIDNNEAFFIFDENYDID